MDIIGACEAEGYDFVTKNDNIYVFEDEHNYVFVDTTHDIISNGLENEISTFDFDYDVSTVKQGFVTVIYNIDPSVAPGFYTRKEQINTVDKIDDDYSGHDYTLEIDVKEEGRASVKYCPGSHKIRVSAKPGDSMSLMIKLPHRFKSAEAKDIIFNSKSGPATSILPYKLEFERDTLQHRLDSLKRDQSYATLIAPEADLEELSQREYDTHMDILQQRLDDLRILNSEGHIFVYNKESGHVTHNSFPSVTDFDGTSYLINGASFSSSIVAIDALPGVCYDESEKISAKRIVKHLDDLDFDIHEFSATGQMFDTFKSGIVKEIHFKDVKKGMVIAYNKGIGCNSYDIFEVTGITEPVRDRAGKEIGVRVSYKAGFNIDVNGELDDYSTVEAGDMLYDEGNEYLSDRKSIFLMDDNVMEASSLLDKIFGDEHRSYSSDDDSKISKVEKAISDEISQGRNLHSIWEL